MVQKNSISFTHLLAKSFEYGLFKARDLTKLITFTQVDKILRVLVEALVALHVELETNDSQ